MSDTVAEPTAPAAKPSSAPPERPPSPLRRLYTRVSGWGFYLATTLIVEAFLFFECTLDVRVYGMERLREVKCAGRNPLLVIWHGQGMLPMATFRKRTTLPLRFSCTRSQLQEVSPGDLSVDAAFHRTHGVSGAGRVPVQERDLLRVMQFFCRYSRKRDGIGHRGRWSAGTDLPRETRPDLPREEGRCGVGSGWRGDFRRFRNGSVVDRIRFAVVIVIG